MDERRIKAKTRRPIGREDMPPRATLNNNPKKNLQLWNKKPRNGYGRLKVRYDKLMTNYNDLCSEHEVLRANFNVLKTNLNNALNERDKLRKDLSDTLGDVSSLTGRLGKKDALCRELWRALGCIRRKVWIYKHKGEKPV